MARKTEQHRFLKAWLQDILEELDDGWYRIVPWWLLLFSVIGGTVAFYMPDAFWTAAQENTTVFYGAILTMNGIILALSWGTFAKIYDTIGAPGFGEFLRKNKVLNRFLFFVSYVHATQIIALLGSAVALVVTQFEGIELDFQRAALAIALALAGYAIKTAGGSVTVMHLLIRYRADFDAQKAEATNNVHRL